MEKKKPKHTQNMQSGKLSFMSIRKDSFYLIYLTEQQSVPITRYSPFAAINPHRTGNTAAKKRFVCLRVV